MPDRSTIDAALARIAELMQSGSWPIAEAECRTVLELAPQDPQAWFDLGLCALQRRALSDAVLAIRQAIAFDPGPAIYWNVLGAALREIGHWPQSAEASRQSLARNPHDSVAWANLAAAELSLGKLSSAQAAYEQSLALAPDRFDVLTDYAILLSNRGQPQRAAPLLRNVLEHDPNLVAAWIALGNVFGQIGEFEPAISCYRQALARNPTDRAALLNVALALMSRWRLAESKAALDTLMAAEPASAEAWSLLGTVLRLMGHSSESLAAIRRSIELAPRPEFHSRLLLGLQYADDISPALLLEEHRRWDAEYCRQIAQFAPRPASSRSPDAPLRIGFLSADFSQHATAFLLLPLLEHLDHASCTTLCYADSVNDDEFTARFRAAASEWHTVAGRTSDELAAQIHNEQLDVLVDLIGHTGMRLPVFAKRLAPVQITWLAYVGTTGMAAMDFLLADRFHIQFGEEANYVERILRMPNGYACYGPHPSAPDVSPLPALAAGHVTFGSFNNPAKHSPRTLDAWAEILRRVPSARLFLKFGGLDQPDHQNHLRGQFATRAVDPARLEFEGWSPLPELLAAYNRVDLALDTQPYSGGATTCDALWMGVPVLTFPGKTFAGRHATSHLTNAGYEQFVAPDAAAFVGLAATWASRLDELAAIRLLVRDQLRRSPLCDAPRFARDFLSVIRQACESGYNPS